MFVSQQSALRELVLLVCALKNSEKFTMYSTQKGSFIHSHAFREFYALEYTLLDALLSFSLSIYISRRQEKKKK
jgi:hypothetical protein